MDAASLGVLRDVAFWALWALFVGTMSYGLMGALRKSPWQSFGYVDARSFISADAWAVVAVLLLMLSGLNEVPPSSTSGQEKTAPTITLVMVLSGIVTQLVICLVMALYLRVLRGLSPADLFGLKKVGVWGVLGWSVLLLIPTMMIMNPATYWVMEWMKTFWPANTQQETVTLFQTTQDPFLRLLFALSAALCAPLMEEIIFRGFLYGVIKRYTDGIFAAVTSSVLFSLVHLHVGTSLPLAILGLALCAAYEITGTLFVPMVMHALFNSATLVVMVFFPELAAR